jgi:predicted nucleic acid-binding Zn ribbon protein
MNRYQDPYERLRRRQARARERQERAAFDPSPPTDEDWTVEEEGTDGLRRLRPPTAVGETLAGLLSRRGWGERLHAATLAARWEDLVGPALAERCEPVRLAGGCLVVRAESQAWATQLRYLQGQLLTNTNDLLGANKVREVRLVVGPLERGREVPPER